MRKTWIYGLVLGATIAAALSTPVFAEEKDKEAAVRSLPGYVDFSALDAMGQEAKVEVNLRDPMLGLVSKFVGNDEPDLRSLLASLKLVRVRVYNITPETAKQLMEAGSTTAAKLDKQGWERVVRVRDEGEHVDVYFKPSSKAEWIDGVLVIALGDDDNEAAFVNIVGTIRPEDVARISDELNIEGLDRVRVENKTRVKN